MTPQEQFAAQERFAADHMAAFPKPSPYLDTLDYAYQIWRQQAKRHKEEIAELLGALEIGLECSQTVLSDEESAPRSIYREARVSAARDDVEKIMSVIAKYGVNDAHC